jgi:hypothetical protein
MVVLGGLSIHILPVSDLDDLNLDSPIVDRVDHPIRPDTKSVQLESTGELFEAFGPRFGLQGLNPGNDAFSIFLRADGIEFFSRARLDK